MCDSVYIIYNYNISLDLYYKRIYIYLFAKSLDKKKSGLVFLVTREFQTSSQCRRGELLCTQVPTASINNPSAGRNGRPDPTQQANPLLASRIRAETFFERKKNPTPVPTYPRARRWRRWRWTSPSPRRRPPATRPRRRGRGGAAAEVRACASTTCSTSTTCSSRSGRRPTTSTASRPSATTSTPEVTFLLDSARP